MVFEDLQFSLDRLNSFFLRSFREWTIMIPDVNLSFLRGVLGSVSFRFFCILLVYLYGVPVCGSHLLIYDLTCLSKKKKRLSSWKRQYISKGGRLTLIRSTLSSLPIYFLSLFRMPKLVCSRLKKIQRDFLWGGGNLERKPHLVNWNTVCLEKSRGGLGVRSLSKMNKALLCKWCWWFPNERDSLWRLVISTKFGEEDGGWNTSDIRGGYGTGLWTDIRKE